MNWAAHFRKTQAKQVMNLRGCTLKVCSTKSAGFMTWFQIYWHGNRFSGLGGIPDIPLGFTDLMVVSYLGLESVVQLLLERGAKVNEPDTDYGGALNMAALGK